MNCRISKKKSKVFLNFGKMPLANGFIKKNKITKEYYFPLKVAFSQKLSLVQLCTNPHPNKMFNKTYPFYTSSSSSMIKHFNKFARFVKKKYLKKNSLIIELGSNDGTFLSNFDKKKSYGFEPSKSVHDVAKKQGIQSINKFFNLKNISKLKKNYNKFDLIVGSNVFCHIPNQIELMKSIDKLLSINGTIILEEPYLGSMYKKVSYDQIYDEHIYMFSLTSIEKIYRLFNFQLVDAFPQSTHGGSMRYILKRKGNIKKSKRLLKMMKLEKKRNVDSLKGCKIFEKKVQNSKIKLIKKINKILSTGERICGYGATSKSTTILNYCGIDNTMIDCIFDTTPDKINKLTPGTHIPVKDYKYFKKSSYKHVFLFAWNHKKEILKKEKNKKNIKWFSHL
ncbi:class I SAM-dependent methyltransferase [Candidatus Pelagibacter bacterium]|nr:class I SAM-dependent methyltransferase [Candidatus Pelagibacter bacterium]